MNYDHELVYPHTAQDRVDKYERTIALSFSYHNHFVKKIKKLSCLLFTHAICVYWLLQATNFKANVNTVKP